MTTIDSRNALNKTEIDQMIQSVTASVASEWNAVNSAFADRIAEYIDARNKIQAHLAKVIVITVIYSSKKKGDRSQKKNCYLTNDPK